MAEQTTTSSLSQQMSVMCQTFLDKIRLASNNNGTNLGGTLNEIDDELETRFKAVSKIDHDNVIKKLVSQGFKRQPVVSSLNILLKDGYRIPITGEKNVYNFCNSNHMTDAMYEAAEKKVRGQVLDFQKENEYPFRVTASVEQKVSQGERESIKASFNVMEKTYRYIRRVTLSHENYPYLVIDMSTVKQSTKYQQSFLSSGIFNIQDTYEIEIEFKKDPDSYFKGTAGFKQGLKLTDANMKKTVISQFQKYIKYVLGGIQESNYPISIKVQNAAHTDYTNLLLNRKEGTDVKEDAKASRRSLFLGPSSKTLQIDNIVPLKTGDDLKVPNIRVPGAFCVTEKADGERHLMFVNAVGKIYLITSNMQIKFTGATCDPKVCKNTIIDGELISHDKKRNFINTFAAFDLYYLNGEDVRFLKFMPIPRVLEKHLEKKTGELNKEFEKNEIKENDADEKEGEKKTKEEEKWATKYRLTLLNEIMNAIRLQLATATSSTALTSSSAMTFKTKDFYPAAQNAALTKEDDILAVYNIFRASKAVLETEFPYETDGVIFTHTSFGVGGHDIGHTGPLHKATWEYSMKWKPSRLNTNDFLVITDKDKTKGGDKITSKFQDGTNMLNLVQSLEYKHLQLFCGNRSQNEIFEHPCEDVYNGVFPKRTLDQGPGTKRNVYQATPFVPINPYDANAAFSSVLLNKDGLMITEEGQPFESDTIVEFRYDTTHHKWIPLRVRYDKTAEYKGGKSQYGNAFETANSNWTSIHFPVTQHMITTGRMDDGEEIRETEYNPDAYYKNDSDVQTQTRGLRDFHNQYVKQWLIKSVCRPGNTLIDLACGKAGDLQKWVHARLSFVYGIDYSQDNLTNLLNGACARYLNSYKKFRNMPGALFVHGDSSKNIITGAAMFNQRSKEINEVVFGERRRQDIMKEAPLGKGVMMQANRGKEGFNVTSCQFAMHYMFKSPTTFYNFIENIAECTKNNGYYIATCYDGAKIFDLLKGKSKDSIVKETKLVWEIVKKYGPDREIFAGNDTSLGMEISVYQESINAWFSEYLVNFELFDKTMNEYGMYLLTDAELNEINFPLKKSSGLFEDLFSHMIGSPNSDKMYGSAAKMQDYEKKISFLNRYFIYRRRNHTKRDYARITAAHLLKHGLANVSEDAVIDDAAGDAYTEHKMGEASDSDQECHYDSRLHHVLSKITREKSKKSANIQNILHLIEDSASLAKDGADHPSIHLLKNIDEQLKKYKVAKDPNAGKEFICDRLIKYLNTRTKDQITKNKENDIPPPLNKDTRIIDIGGGNGNLLHCFGEKFNIPKDNLVSIENGSFEYTYTHSDTVTYKTLAPKDDNNIQNISGQVFKDADYILCMVTLHHMTNENIRNTIQFIKMHIKRGGYVMIKEHDADSQDTKCLINWEHHLYRLMEHVDEAMPDKEIQDYVDNVYIGNYKEEAYFDRLFKSADFKLVTTLNHVLDPTKTGPKKWERNPTQLYWKVYQYAA